MTTSEDGPDRSEYGRAEDACLARAAEAVQFGGVTPAEQAAVGEHRVDPLRTVLVRLIGDLRGRRRR